MDVDTSCLSADSVTNLLASVTLLIGLNSLQLGTVDADPSAPKSGSVRSELCSAGT